MKVGTDGTMLGCWADVGSAGTILDIGCGSGVLSIICAQKNSNASIVGIDIEEGAVLDARQNVDALQESWRSRIAILQTRLQDFQSDHAFDVIISNPPFFENSQFSPDDTRNFARHTNSLHYSEILKFAQQNLTEKGKIFLVLPYENGKTSVEVAAELDFYPKRMCSVHPVPQKPPHRLLLEFCKEKVTCKETSLTIETGLARHDYTEEYKALGKDFYLYF